MKVEKLAKNGQMVQNCYPLSPCTRNGCKVRMTSTRTIRYAVLLVRKMHLLRRKSSSSGREAILGVYASQVSKSSTEVAGE